MSERQSREQITTRVAPDARAVIDRIAKAERTTPSHIARRWLEDAACEHVEQTGRAA
jgi:hypothetical protein